eukprot:gnl/Hemi2/25479_TR8573_c0_g1_i1.p1 gnl/Hemi2/25479_TR8573_c0_g1~~gnl/Hemi2/25479_TR8573_c0_g1_i1.p1  ORF type:complete len:171 (-),score=46.80 gnl/Hemi2/25479_TR8573_c0_g1_i1:118-588(-)
MLRGFAGSARVGLTSALIKRCFSSKVPTDRKYTASHEWVKIDDKTGTVGITDFAQSALGDIVFIDLPQVGLEYQQKASFAAIESCKAASDVYAPIVGTVSEVNEKLRSDSKLVNKSPFEEGWLAKFSLKNATPFRDQYAGLMDASQYEELLKKQQK